MKKIITLLVLSLFLFSGAKGQFLIDFSDPGTYQVTCGNVVTSQWTVKNQQCELSLPPMVLQNTSSLEVEFEIKINQSGNLETEDEFTIMHKINNDGAWIVDTVVLGTYDNNVRIVHDSIIISEADTIFFKAVAHTNGSNEFWAIKSGDISISNVTPIYFPLPIELLNFEADYNENFSSVDIKWATLTETNNDYFTIERSYNGIDFEGIAYIEGAGNSNSVLTYEYIDFEKPEQLTYYRLRQTDFDGKTTVSNPVAVRPEENSSSPEIAGVNAQYGEILLNVYVPEAQNVSIEILDVSGRVVVFDNKSLDAGSHTIKYNASMVNSSIVFVRIINEYSEQISKKVLMNS